MGWACYFHLTLEIINATLISSEYNVLLLTKTTPILIKCLLLSNKLKYTKRTLFWVFTLANNLRACISNKSKTIFRIQSKPQKQSGRSKLHFPVGIDVFLLQLWVYDTVWIDAKNQCIKYVKFSFWPQNNDTDKCKHKRMSGAKIVFQFEFLWFTGWYNVRYGLFCSVAHWLWFFWPHRYPSGQMHMHRGLFRQSHFLFQSNGISETCFGQWCYHFQYS